MFLDPINVGNNIKKYRLSKGYSQSDLAKKMNCSQKHISFWESGKALISTDKLYELKYILGIDLNRLDSNDLELMVNNRYHSNII